ncbi:MAG: metal ABC transporter substrate-binding protein [Polyangiales bacterium]
MIGVQAKPLRALLFVLALALACSKDSASDAHRSGSPEGPDTIYTVNYPLSYFARRLAPADVRVVFPAPGGVDPAFWKPSVDMIADYQRANLIALNGAGYARWTQHTTLPSTRLVVTADRCRASFLRTEQSVQHRHGPEGEHAHGDVAFTTWLDLRLALCQARHLRAAIAKKFPEDDAAAAQRFEALERELLALDRRLVALGKSWGSRPLLASHPVYQYLADAYGLTIESLHLEPDQPLTDEDWKTVDALLQRHPATLMLWEATPLRPTAEGLRARGLDLVLFDPVGNVPEEGDFLSVMDANVERLECATKAKACPR